MRKYLLFCLAFCVLGCLAQDLICLLYTSNPASLPDTDWENLVWRNAFRQNYFLQMTGGNEKTTFNMSAEFYKNQFIERYSFEDAGNFRVASQTNISKRVKFSEILTVGFNNTDPHLYGQTNNDYVYYRQVPTLSLRHI